MSAILLSQKPLENSLFPEEIEKKHDNLEKDEKDEAIKGKSKTYLISKTLGKGTFGKVKLAYNIENKKEKYACKILLKSNIRNKDDKMRCKREINILKKMHHVNIVRTYEIISTDKKYYILMDFCSKGELFNYIVERQHLSEEKSAFFYYQLINGIEYIHKKGICHRDLKPENLLLTEKNKLKIIDFGLSNYFRGNLLKTPCGSPCYASPEMVMGNKYDGFCIDIWSSGIILYAMLCGYLPFEEIENDEYNEILFRNIIKCNVEYPNEFISPVAKDLLSKILVKDPKKRITIEEIKSHNFYLYGELLYKQIFERNNENYLFIIDDDYYDGKFIDFDKSKNNDLNNNLENNKYLELKEKISMNNDSKKKEKIFEDNKEDKIENKEENDYIFKNYNKDKRNENNDIIRLLTKEIVNNSSKKNKKDQLQIKNIKNNKNNNKDILDRLNQIIPDKKYKGNKSENINQKEILNKNNKNKKSQKKEMYDSNQEEKKHKKHLSMQIYNSIKLPINNNEKDNKEKIYENDLNINSFKTNKNQKSKKEYSVQEENIKYNKCSNINPKENNLNKQYLKTEIYLSNSKNKTKKSHYKCTLLNKKIIKNNNKFDFDNILKSLQNINIFKNKTPKKFSTKQNLINKQNHMQSKSNDKKKYRSYSQTIKRFSKKNKNLYKINEKNVKYPKKNYIPLTTHSNIRNSFNILNDNILNYFNSKYFYNYKELIYKNFKPNKKFLRKKNDKNNTENNYINILNKDNYFKLNKIAKNKNNEEKKLLKYSMNNLLNIKSLENYFSSNGFKKKHSLIEKKTYNEINENNNNIYFNNYNAVKNEKNQISKKSFSNLKGQNNLNYNISENSKPILINSNYIHKNIEKNKNKKNINKIYKSNNKLNKRINSKSKNNNIKTKSHNILNHKMSNINNKNNIDNNIIINFNILKPNIIFGQQRATTKKTKINKLILNTHSNFISPIVENHIISNNLCSTVRNTFFNKFNKKKYNDYKNIDMKQNEKNKEINKIIKSIHGTNKIQGNYKIINNNRKISNEI